MQGKDTTTEAQRHREEFLLELDELADGADAGEPALGGVGGFVEKGVAQGDEVALLEGGFDLAELEGEVGEALFEGLMVDVDVGGVDAEELQNFDDALLGVLPGAQADAKVAEGLVVLA